MKVNVEELWKNTYIIGRENSCRRSIYSLGIAHLQTAKLFNSGKFPYYKETPSYKMFMSHGYEKMFGMSSAEEFLRGYMKQFADNFKSIKKYGYRSDRSRISIDTIGGKQFLIDGNRRIASIMAIGEQREIEVMEGEHRFRRENVEKYLRNLALQSPFIKNDKHILYQPTLGFTENNDPCRTEEFRKMKRCILRGIGDTKGKLILDVGSCFGYFSFALAQLGSYVVGVERNNNRVEASRLISGYYKLDWSNPKFICADISDYMKESDMNYDIVLMISIFHYLCRENLENAWKVINKLAERSDKIILCMDHNGIIESQENVRDFILGNSVLKNAEFLGKVYNNRLLYSFSR